MTDFNSLPTESIHEKGKLLDSLSSKKIVALINKEDKKVASSVGKALDIITNTVLAMNARWDEGGRIIYAGAGTSGRLGILDAAELPPTFGVDEDRVIGLIAGGEKAIQSSLEGVEDDLNKGYKDAKNINISKEDIVIGITASGRTPYVMGVLKKAQESEAMTVGIACNKNAKIKNEVEYPVLLDTGPEIIMGSTRMKAGTAQKMVLNMLSTTLMILQGKVYKNYMVDMQIKNEKLEKRAIRMISDISNITKTQAEKNLKRAQGNIKVAILIEHGFSPEKAKKEIKKENGKIRSVLDKHNLS